MNTFYSVAKKGQLSLGLVFPIEAYQGAEASMQNQEFLAQKAEAFGFRSLWFRDVPFLDPNFGDAGQLYDPWVYMTHIMNQTKKIALASGSIILPLRHPVHTAKSALSLQHLSSGRILLGVASGDRPLEYPAFNQSLEKKSELFRDSFLYTKALMNGKGFYSSEFYGSVDEQLELLPRKRIETPFFVTGHSGQNIEWIAEHADGWLYYPRNFDYLQWSMKQWTDALNLKKQNWKPYLQSLYIDLQETAKVEPIHLGFRSSANYLLAHLKLLKAHGVNHVILNLKYSSRPAEEVIEEIGEKIIPELN